MRNKGNDSDLPLIYLFVGALPGVDAAMIGCFLQWGRHKLECDQRGRDAGRIKSKYIGKWEGKRELECERPWQGVIILYEEFSKPLHYTHPTAYLTAGASH